MLIKFAIGHGRSPRSRRSAERFAQAWTASTEPDGQPRGVAVAVDWPSQGASWLKPARRLTEPAVDAWVISDEPDAWAHMSRRLHQSTAWDAARTVALSTLDTPALTQLADLDALEGLRGTTPDGRLWFIHLGRRVHHTPTRMTPRMDSLLPRTPTEIAPGAVHVPDWLSLEQQHKLVVAWRGWRAGPAPMRHTRMPNGASMSVQTLCLGWHWSPYRYTRTAVDQNDAPVPPLPGWLADLARDALADAYGDPAGYRDYSPDAALVNFYDEHAKLGMHQDKDEQTSAPVVSLSLGASCIFRFGNSENRDKPYTDLELRSGDLFVFGGPARFAYHGVPHAARPSPGPAGIGLDAGRLNITLRQTGLD